MTNDESRLRIADYLSHMLEAARLAVLSPDSAGVHQLRRRLSPSRPSCYDISRLGCGQHHDNGVTLIATVNDCGSGALERALAAGHRLQRLQHRGVGMGVDTALDLYTALTQWLRMIRNGMSRDISWRRQGGLYVPLYERL
jgi:hypothetical protein